MQKTSSAQNFLDPKVSVSDSLLLTLFVAAILHALFLFGVSFAFPTPHKVERQIEITLANMPSKKAPKKATYLAQDNQVGAGEKIEKAALRKQQLASQGESDNKPPRQETISAESKPKASVKLLTQKTSAEKILIAKKEAPPTEKVSPRITEEALRQQIAQLGAQIRYDKQSSELTKIKFVNSVSTHKYVAAQYMKDWERKVERTGNMNFPEVARIKGFSGTLTMDVGIDANGNIYSIRISKSSGIKALDDAAKRIVRLSAPFSALPKELLEELDILVIPRVWSFSNETGVVTK